MSMVWTAQLSMVWVPELSMLWALELSLVWVPELSMLWTLELSMEWSAELSLVQVPELSMARQLEEKDRSLKKHDAYYKEQLARLEERSAQFYKVTTEQYQKAADEVSARFKRYESHPICGELQDKILQCYREHAQETLSCSALASQYLHCVNHAKQQRMLGRGG
ncbi:LOW QUALITY PROTEIN: MICOS complex subunit MIC19-like [Geothlypis trichas]